MSAPEFDGTPMTKREIRIARQAVDRAIHRAWPWIEGRRCAAWIGSDAIRDELYPRPMVTRPRVEVDPHAWCVERSAGKRRPVYWTAHDRGIEPCDSDGEPMVAPTPVAIPTAERVRVWADLLANPTEEVEDDA